MSESTALSLTSVFRSVATEFPGVVSAFVRLPEDEAASLLRQVLKETQALDLEDAASRVASRLRELAGLDRGETETADILSADDQDAWDSICAGALR